MLPRDESRDLTIIPDVSAFRVGKSAPKTSIFGRRTSAVLTATLVRWVPPRLAGAPERLVKLALAAKGKRPRYSAVLSRARDSGRHAIAIVQSTAIDKDTGFAYTQCWLIPQ